VGQAELELQLRAWKKLAVSKQMLIGAATDALGLDAECSREELKEALNSATRRAIEADAQVKRAKEEAEAAIAEMQAKLAKAERSLSNSQTSLGNVQTENKSLEERMATLRAANVQDNKKLSGQLAEKQKALKAVNVALADTPENVVKKLKGLKKEKLDEANARKRVESDLRTLRKDKQAVDKRLTEAEETLTKGATLVEQFREMHSLCEAQRERLIECLGSDEDVTTPPSVDEELLEAIATSGNAENKDSGKETDKKSRKRK